MQLAIAFEALLKLPQSEKTDRFVDAISMLLGRIERMDLWAQQFYNLRSQIAHEGKVSHARFVVGKSKTGKEDGAQYHSILVFGRQIFQCCLSALVFGERLARKTDLKVKLFTNGERFQGVCQILSNETSSPLERLQSVRGTAFDLSKYQYVPETGLKLDLMAGTVRLVCKCLLESGEPATLFSSDDLQACSATGQTFETLAVLERLVSQTHLKVSMKISQSEETASVLFGVVWHYSFMNYFHWKSGQT